VAESPASTLSTDQVTEILGLLRRVDSVELKFTVPDTDRRSAVAALGIDPLDADAPGRVLRHTRSPAQPARCRSAGAAGPATDEEAHVTLLDSNESGQSSRMDPPVSVGGV
jgi:hypothetical protein